MQNGTQRIILASSVFFGLAAAIYLIFVSPFTIGADFKAYYYASRAFLAGESIYTSSPPGLSGHHFIYLPIVILLYVPHGIIGSWLLGFLLQSLITLFAIGWLGMRIIGYIERYTDRDILMSDKALIYAYLAGTTASVSTLLQGQINLVLGALIGIGTLWWVEGHDRRSSVFFSIAALLKIFPAAFGLLYFADGREGRRGIGTAIIVGLGTLLLSIALFGVRLHKEFLNILLNRFSGGTFVGGLDPSTTMVTLRRPISVLFPSVPSVLMTVATAVLLAPVVWYLFQETSTTSDRLVTALGVSAAIIMFFPSYFMYLSLIFAPLVVALYTLEPEQPRQIILSGAFLVGLGFSLEHLTAVVNMTPIPAGIQQGLLSIMSPVLTIGTPPLYGLLLITVGCIVHQRRRSNVGSPTRAAADD